MRDAQTMFLIIKAHECDGILVTSLKILLGLIFKKPQIFYHLSENLINNVKESREKWTLVIVITLNSTFKYRPFSFNYVVHKLFAQTAKKKNSLVNRGIRVLIFLKEKGVGSLVI